MASTVDSKVSGVLSSPTSGPEKLELSCLEVNEQANDAETCTVDSGIAESSDHASSVSAPDSPNQPFSTSGSLEGELDLHVALTSKTNPNEQKSVLTQSNEPVAEPGGDRDCPTSRPEARNEESSLLECLEPRPPNSDDGGGEGGGMSPKDVHRHLMKKVQNMSSNGHRLSDGSDSIERSGESRDHSPMRTPSPASAAGAPPTQPKSWSLKLPFLRKCVDTFVYGMCVSAWG